MLVVGLTGGIATGKSTVSDLLKARKVPVIDADVLARQVVEPGTPALRRIVAAFGTEILQSDGSLDRKKLGAVIFPDATQRQRLNAIVHPAVRRAMAWAVLRYWARGYKYVVLDVPLLVEGGLWRLCGEVVVVYCSAETQLRRLTDRDRSSDADASARLRAQIPIGDKVDYADVVIDNSGSREELEAQVDTLVRRLERRAGWTWLVSWLVPPFGMLSAFWGLLWRNARRNLKRT